MELMYWAGAKATWIPFGSEIEIESIVSGHHIWGDGCPFFFARRREFSSNIYQAFYSEKMLEKRAKRLYSINVKSRLFLNMVPLRHASKFEIGW
jgi:hypothetical protein